MTVLELAEKIGGTLEGDGTPEVKGLAGLHEAGVGDISFLANMKYKVLMKDTAASAVVVGRDWKDDCSCAVIKVSNPDEAFARAAQLICPDTVKISKGVHPSAVVSDDAVLGEGVSVGACSVIESDVVIGAGTAVLAGCCISSGVTIGSNCLIHTNVSIREGTIIGDRVIIHNGAVIGSDGFGNYLDKGLWKKIPQVGIVVIGNDAEIGANVTIDRARFGKTVIGDNVKIDNLIQIAHNCKIGRNTAMASGVGISGSTEIGANCLLGGQSGYVGHIKVGDNCVVGAQAAVLKDIPAGSFVSGYPAMPHKKAMKLNAHVMRLPFLKEKVDKLEKKIAELEKRLGKES